MQEQLAPLRSASEAPAPGRLSQAFRRLLMRPAAVVANETLADGYQLITLEGPELAGVGWIPGQKVQLAMGAGFATRTYTPIEWNETVGRTCILGYAHGDGPGSAWVLGAQPGDPCDLFGPRGSLDARGLPGPLALFGDETAIGLGYALNRHVRPVTSHFEVASAEHASVVADQLGLGRAAFHVRRADDAHLPAMEAAIPALAAAGASFVLVGKSGTVQRLRQALKREGVPSSRFLTKAYWAPGKTGLD